MKSRYKSDIELVKNAHCQLFTINKLLKKGTLDINEAGEAMACSLTLNWSGGKLYMNTVTENIFNTSTMDAFRMGEQFLLDYFDKEHYEQLTPYLEYHLDYILEGNTFNFIDAININGTRKKFLAILRVLDSNILSKSSLGKDYTSKTDFGLFNRLVSTNSISIVLAYQPQAFMKESKKTDNFLGFDDYLYKNFIHFRRLSNREKKIINLWASGNSSKQMANALSLSVKTIETHRKNIYAKLEIKSLFQLLKFAQAFDLIE